MGSRGGFVGGGRARGGYPGVAPPRFEPWVQSPRLSPSFVSQDRPPRKSLVPGAGLRGRRRGQGCGRQAAEEGKVERGPGQALAPRPIHQTASVSEPQAGTHPDGDAAAAVVASSGGAACCSLPVVSAAMAGTAATAAPGAPGARVHTPRALCVWPQRCGVEPTSRCPRWGAGSRRGSPCVSGGSGVAQWVFGC